MNRVDIQALNLSTDICVKKKKKSRASLQCNSLKSNMENHQIDSNLHPDPAQTACLQWIREQESIYVQVRCRSPQQQREKLLLIAALNYINSLEEKKPVLTTMRINIQTQLKTGMFCWFLFFVLWLFWVCLFVFNLIHKQLLHLIKKTPLALNSRGVSSQSFVYLTGTIWKWLILYEKCSHSAIKPEKEQAYISHLRLQLHLGNCSCKLEPGTVWRREKRKKGAQPKLTAKGAGELRGTVPEPKLLLWPTRPERQK